MFLNNILIKTCCYGLQFIAAYILAFLLFKITFAVDLEIIPKSRKDERFLHRYIIVVSIPLAFIIMLAFHAVGQGG